MKPQGSNLFCVQEQLQMFERQQLKKKRGMASQNKQSPRQDTNKREQFLPFLQPYIRQAEEATELEKHLGWDVETCLP